MSKCFTRLKDTDILICSYLDDITLLKLSHTCKYFYDLTADTIWKRRTMSIMGARDYAMFDHIIPTPYSELTFKEYYFTQLRHNKLKFEGWHLDTLEKLNYKEKIRSYRSKAKELTVFVKDGRIDLLMVFHVTTSNHVDLWFYIVSEFEPNLMTTALTYGRHDIIFWFVYCSDEYITRDFRDPDAKWKVSPLTLWYALGGGHIDILNVFKDNFGLLPCPYSIFMDYRTLGQSEDTPGNLISLGIDKLPKVLDWCYNNGLVDKRFNRILCILAVDMATATCVLEWCCRNKYNLCENGTGSINPYAEACDKYSTISIFDKLYLHKMIPTPAIVEWLVTEFGEDNEIIKWLKDKGLVM